MLIDLPVSVADALFAALQAARAATPTPPVQDPVVVVPSEPVFPEPPTALAKALLGVRPTVTSKQFITVPYVTTMGTPAPNAMINPSQAIIFAITPTRSTLTNYASFRTSPTNASAYWQRVMAMSDIPLDFSGALAPASVAVGQEPTMYFTVGGRPKDKYGREIATYPDLVVGKTYYVTVAHIDPAQSGRINYALTVAG